MEPGNRNVLSKMRRGTEMNPDEEIANLENSIAQIDITTHGENQSWFIKRLELRIQLESAKQLKRIADLLEKIETQKRGF